MKKYSSIIILICVSISFSVFSCSDSEKRLSPFLNQTKVILDLGLPSVHAANDDRFWDKVRRFFIKDAVAQSAPAALGSVLVRVSGPDLGITESSFSAYDSITLNVASGSFRQFDVTAYVAAGSPSAALSFRGFAIANLPAGETVNVPVAMALYETKIVMGDAANPNSFGPGRIVAIDNLGTPNWTVLTESILMDKGYTGGTNTFKPYDISFDSRGRIYIANNSPSASALGVIRIDDLNGTNLIQTGSALGVLRFGENIGRVVSIAVDRVRNKVYFANSVSMVNIYQSDLDGQNTVSRTPAGISVPVYGIDVGDNGILYVAAGSSVYIYDWESDGVLGSMSGFSTPYDVLYRPPYVYVANSQDASGQQIFQLTVNSDYSFAINAYYGNLLTTTDTAPGGTHGTFYGAHRFAAIRNDGLYVMDCDPPFFMRSLARLIRLNGLSDAGWSAFGSYGTGDNQFTFYSGC